MHLACVCYRGLFSGALLSHFAFAQSAKTSEQGGSQVLETVLDRADDNIESYLTKVPNVYCTEHAVAKRKNATSAMGAEIAVPGGSIPLERSATVEVSVETKSIFRLRRLADPSATGLFEETRVVQQITKSADAPGYEDVANPELLYGVFSNGLNILSREGRACFQFHLNPVKPGKAIVIDFEDLASAKRAAECPATNKGTGTVRIDPTTMHVREIERKLSNYPLVGSIRGTWAWKETYAPVVLQEIPTGYQHQSLLEVFRSIKRASGTTLPRTRIIIRSTLPHASFQRPSSRCHGD